MFLIVKCQHGSGACRSHSHPVLSHHEVLRKYTELSHSTLPFLTLCFHKKDLSPTPRFGQYSLHLGIFFQWLPKSLFITIYCKTYCNSYIANCSVARSQVVTWPEPEPLWSNGPRHIGYRRKALVITRMINTL